MWYIKKHGPEVNRFVDHSRPMQPAPFGIDTLEVMGISSEEQERVFEAFRHWGYLQADLDPLGYLKPQPHPDLEGAGKAADLARRYYCGTIGVEFAHIPEPDRRRWIQARIETEPPRSNSSFVLERLIRAAIFEQVLQSRYPGTRRFSLEGVVALVPLLDEVLHCAAEHGTEPAVVALSHRGRLNVIVHIAGRPAAEVFGRFEDVAPRSFLGGGDVKYHLGAAGAYVTSQGHKISVHLVSNPSHLEAVDLVAFGRARAERSLCAPEGAGWRICLTLRPAPRGVIPGRGVL